MPIITHIGTIPTIIRIPIRTDTITLTTIPMALNGSNKWPCGAGDPAEIERESVIALLSVYGLRLPR